MDILDIFGHFYLNHLSPLWVGSYVSQWRQHGDHGDVQTTWGQYGDNMGTTSGQCGDNMGTMWGPQGCGDHVGTMGTTCGTTWGLWGCADHMGTTWRQHVDNMRTMWRQHGVRSCN